MPILDISIGFKSSRRQNGGPGNLRREPADRSDRHRHLNTTEPPTLSSSIYRPTPAADDNPLGRVDGPLEAAKLEVTALGAGRPGPDDPAVAGHRVLDRSFE